ncbi:DMT family transporter [Mameliella sediminis]|uniref:DMT family transporter n=1 Tax=Mameliella sediminis TaxID=2836866 RepID=UPI001C4705D3|nr:DMT family transporter [Mameliella sediminis]MBY6115902.1 DMT family transporter [Antarctobacter heliothermus]MBY6145320.1 DMT family transporter [Mameliella alba]MBV7393956.1 DMT family transporter [Mameliella sediminis]MBY6162130.1 DMT family transporter [Mameliella alba]MBY6170600.1 DMT family transporter [Mameliella alba]
MSEAKPREDRTAAGVLLMALAVVGFTCIDSSAKWLIVGGMPALQVVFARYTGHFLVATAIYAAQEGRGAFVSNAPWRQLLRSLFLLGSTVCNFTALQFLPITVTTTIMFAGPIVVTLLAIPILGETVGLRRIIAVCVGFIGVIVVMQPWGVSFHPAMFLSLIALCMAALYFIMTRLLAGIEGNATQQIWSSGFAALALLPFVLTGWVWPQGSGWIAFVLIGIFGASGHIAAVTAHRWADASILAPVIYIQIFLAALAGVLLFDTWPTIWTLGGGAIIIASGLYIWQRERAVRGRVRRPVPSTR